MWDTLAGKNIPVSGFMEAARFAGHDLLPLAWCAAGPGGTVTRDAYERMADLLTAGLKCLSRVDAVYLDLHGAMVAEHLEDGEGELLRRVREIVGERVPVVASLDLHANVSETMLRCADHLVAYRTYPHVDMARTGAEVLRLLDIRLARGSKPCVAWRRGPFLIPLCWQSTGSAPAGPLYAGLRPHGESPVVSVSLTMGFPAADVHDCGPMVWAYADSPGQAEQAVESLAAQFLAAEHQFDGLLLTPEQAVDAALAHARAHARAGPVVIADAQDNPGAGGSSDTMGLIRALVERGACDAVCGLVADPAAASAAHAAGEGAVLRLALGGRSGVPGDAPLVADYVVERVHDGHVQATGAVFRGYKLQLGPSACLRIGGVRILVTSRKVQLLDLALVRFMGLEPGRQCIVAVKSTVHFRADFEPVASRVLVCAAPGLFPLDPAALPWRRLRAGVRLRPGGPAFCPEA